MNVKILTCRFYNKHKSGDFILPSESVYEDLYDTAIRVFFKHQTHNLDV